MLTFLTPAALLALTGLLVPVAIYLWNRRPGREVAVGSLRWLAAGANRRLRNLKPEQLGLLLLRAALLAVLAVAGAGPGWRTARRGSRGVVLLSTEAAALPALAGLRAPIDSLRRQGYALRWLTAGFPPVPSKVWQQLRAHQPGATADSLAASVASATTNPQNQAFAWARVQQAVAAFPGQPLLVVTGAALRNFRGSHAPLPAAVHWQMLPDTTATNWLQAAARRGDSLCLVLGHGAEHQTRFRTLALAWPAPGEALRAAGLAPLRLRQNAASTRFGLVGEAPTGFGPDTSTVALQTRPLRAVIYATAPYRTDARVLRAGLRAASVGLPVALELTTTATVPNPAAPPDWLFWLTDAPVPTAWQSAVRAGTCLWQEAAGPGVADTAHLAPNASDAAPVAVLRREAGTAPSPGTETVWADGRGRPVLLRQPRGRGATYCLTTRLSPEWSELAEAPQLPAWLLALLQPPQPASASANAPGLAEYPGRTRSDQRALDPTQLLANPRPPAAKAPTGATPQIPASNGFSTTDLRPWLVLLAGLLLLLERLLAHRQAALVSPTTA